MNNIKTSSNKEKLIPKLEKFSKIKYLKKRWELFNLNDKDLKEYNKWSTHEKYKVIVIKLKLEHYLTTNILYDLGGIDSLFDEKMKKNIFQKLEKKILPFQKCFKENS